MSRPTLKAVILDFSAVNHLDVTAAQALVDLRNQFDRYTDPDTVEWHFAGVANRWTKRALVASGFGAERKSRLRRYEEEEEDGSKEKGLGSGGKVKELGPLVAVAEAEGGGDGGDGRSGSLGGGKGKEGAEISPATSSATQQEEGQRGSGKRLVPVFGINRPFFHVDVITALKSAIRNVEGRVSDD